MKIEYKHATLEDAKTLVEIYNRSFYEDYIRFGQCPAYGKSIEQMEESIKDFPKEIILYDNQPVGVISVENKENVKFYTQRCGFSLGKTEMDGKVEVIQFYMER